MLNRFKFIKVRAAGYIHFTINLRQDRDETQHEIAAPDARKSCSAFGADAVLQRF